MKTLKEYLRTDKKFKNLKVPVRRKAGNNTLAKSIEGKKPKKLITRIDMAKNQNEEMTSTSSIPNPAITVQGPKFGWINPLHKGRKKPTLITRGGMDRRFKEWERNSK